MKKEDNNKTPRLIRFGYLSNTVYFIPDNLSLTIRVDPKKEKNLAKESQPRRSWLRYKRIKRILFDPFSRIKAIWIASQAGMI